MNKDQLEAIKKEYNLFSVKVADLKTENAGMLLENEQIAKDMEGFKKRHQKVIEELKALEIDLVNKQTASNNLNSYIAKQKKELIEVQDQTNEAQKKTKEAENRFTELDKKSNELTIQNRSIEEEFNIKQKHSQDSFNTLKEFDEELKTREALLRKRLDTLLIQEQLK
jgi:hypothetical protein